MKNNVYDTHNIGHLSASFLNTWVSSPWQAIAKLAGLEGSVGPAAYRGIAAEEGLEFAVRKNNLAEGIAKANMKFNELNGSSQFGEKELKALPNYVEQAYSLYSQLEDVEAYQQKIVYQHEDLPIPFVGYIDFLYPQKIRDMKTVARNTYNNGPSLAHCRQVAIYGWAYPDHELWIDYVTPREVISHKVQNVADHQKTVMKIVHGLEKFLSISNDTNELASILTPDVDDWRFNDGIRKQAGDIWPEITI